jgi:phosphohistidine swiveling domain-containing protein
LARGSFAEFVPDPVSPLFATLAVPIALDATQKMMSEFVGIKDNDSYLFEVINGYVYVGIKSKYMLKMLFATITLMKKLMKSSKERWVVVRTRSRETTDKWQRVELSRLSAPELLAGVREIFGITAEYYTVAQSGPIPAASMSELSFSRFYDALVKRKDDPASTTFLLGIENLPLRAEKSLYDLAMWASGQAELANYIKQTPAESICVALQSDAIPSPLSGGFSDRFSAHLAEFGHTLYDLDFAKSTPADDPLPLVEAVKVYIEGKGGNPHERQQNQIERREQAEKAITKRLDSLRRKWFLKFLNQAKDAAPDREDCIADMGLGYPQLRRLARELGRRLTEGGALAKPEDIYWLEAQEVDSLATAMEKGAFLPDHAALVESRKSFWHRARSITPPVTLPEKSWMSKLMVHDNPEGDTLKGYGASAGKVTAPACVMRGPEDFNLMHPGDVIVAVTTTPAWTPLFAMASAVVTDIGGPLSHSSIVAREYGIPAVMATGVCTRRIHSGQIITVDGSTGTVTLAQRNGHPPANDSEIKGASGEGAAGPIEWRPPDPKDVYMRTSVVDLMPDPLSPLFTTWAIPTLRGKMKPLCIRLGMGVPALQEDFYTSINSYAYMNATYPAKTWWWILTRMLPAYPSLLRRMVPIWRDELHPEYQAAVAKYQEKSPEKMSAGELWRDAGAILDSAMYYACGLLFATMGASAGSEGLLTRVYNKVAKQAGDPEANTLLMGWDNIPVRADKSLFDLAMWCREHVELARYMLATTSDRLTEQLKNRQPPASVGASDWQELRERFDAHRQTFGHIIFQLDFAESLPLDNPAPMLENIKMYLRGEGVNPYERQKASEEKRTQTAENIRHRLKGLKRWAFVKALTWGQSLAAVREDALAEIGLGYPILRAMLRELGSRLVHAGAIQQADDIFWLMKDEVEACAYALEGGAELENLSMHVEQRKAFNKKARQETPPPMMPMKKKYMGINTSVWLAESESNRNGNILKGVATSAGKVTAPACVLRGPEDFDQMKPGDVLVTGTTTPAWTPLFAMASAVVTNIGGPLSHGSIVAREYGIPAVMGTGVATKRIQNGQIITVDGSAGMVLLEAA